MYKPNKYDNNLTRKEKENMLEITKDMKLDYDSEVGFIGFKIIGNDEKYPSLLKVQKTILGTEYHEFPKRSLYYDYAYNGTYKWRRENLKPRTEIIVMSEFEFEKLASSMEELLKTEFNLYYVNIFNSDKDYSYYSKKKIEIGTYTKVMVRNGNKTNGHIVGCGGKITLDTIIKNNYIII